MYRLAGVSGVDPHHFTGWQLIEMARGARPEAFDNKLRSAEAGIKIKANNIQALKALVK